MLVLSRIARSPAAMIGLGIEAPRDVAVDRGEVHARKAMQVVEIPFAAASAVCDESVDLGALLVATGDDTLR